MFLREAGLGHYCWAIVAVAVFPFSAVAVTVIVMGDPVVLGSTVSLTSAFPSAPVSTETALRVPLVVLKTIVTPPNG